MEEVKDTRILFRISKDHLDSLDKFAKELKLSRSKVIRLGIDTLIEKYRPGYKGEWQVLNTEFLNTIIGNLGNRIFELENPEAGKYQEAIKAGKEVDRLLREGNRAEADKLLRKREKEGKYTSSGFSWVKEKE